MVLILFLGHNQHAIVSMIDWKERQEALGQWGV
jgi:hypothetical protein